jgi:hypothetical protein
MLPVSPTSSGLKPHAATSSDKPKIAGAKTDAAKEVLQAGIAVQRSNRAPI